MDQITKRPARPAQADNLLHIRLVDFMDYRPAATLLGQNVIDLCQKKGLTLDGLVNRLGWSAETLRNLESGELDITLDELDRLCAALDTAPQDLLHNQA